MVATVHASVSLSDRFHTKLYTKLKNSGMYWICTGTVDNNTKSLNCFGFSVQNVSDTNLQKIYLLRNKMGTVFGYKYHKFFTNSCKA